MSLWKTITENKLVAGLATLAVAGLGIYSLYRKYEKENQDVETSSNHKENLPNQKQINIHQQINKLRQQIDPNNITLQDVKKIVKLFTNYIKEKGAKLTNKFKAQRRKLFPKQSRFSRIGDYMKLSMQKLGQLQKSVMQLQNQQTQLMASLGLNQQKLMQFGAQLGPYMQELMFGENITIQDIRVHLTLKTEYLEVHGEHLIEALIELSPTLSLEEKQFIPLFLNIFLSDEVFQHEPNLDREQFELVVDQYKNQLMPELTQLEKVLMPLMGKLQTVIVGDEMGGMGGLGGYNQYEDMGGMGGMGGMGRNEQAMYQQLQAIRQQDPQAYEQLMAMMQAQMGR